MPQRFAAFSSFVCLYAIYVPRFSFSSYCLQFCSFVLRVVSFTWTMRVKYSLIESNQKWQFLVGLSDPVIKKLIVQSFQLLCILAVVARSDTVGDDNLRIKSLRRRRRLFVPRLHTIWIPSATADQHPKWSASIAWCLVCCRLIMYRLDDTWM